MKASIASTLLLLALLLAEVANAASGPAAPGPAAHEELESIDGLRLLVESARAYSIEDLLRVLPEAYKRNYTFVYRSGSLQAGLADENHPRILLYGRTGRLLLAATRYPGAKAVAAGQDELETIEFREGDFFVRPLVFDGKTSPFSRPAEVNPTRCTVCHGTNPRPIWGAYNMWPGAYGSISRVTHDFIKLGTAEDAAYRAFLAEGRHNDRYQLLPAESAPFKIQDDVVNVTNAVSYDPNGMLSNIVGELNMYRLRNLFMRSPAFQKFKPLIAALAKGCIDLNSDTEFESYFDWTHGGWGETYAQFSARVAEEDAQDFLALSSLTGLRNGDSVRPGYLRLNIGDLDRYGIQFRKFASAVELLASRMRIDFSNATTELVSGRHRYWNGTTFHSADPVYNPEGLGMMDPEMDKRFHHFEPITVFFPKYFGQGIPELEEFMGRYCADLKKLSLEIKP